MKHDDILRWSSSMMLEGYVTCNFDVLCYLLLNRRTATWNLYILYNKELKYTEKRVLMMTSSIRLSSNRP